MNYNNLTDKAAVTGLAFSWSEFRYDYINQDIWTRHVVNNDNFFYCESQTYLSALIGCFRFQVVSSVSNPTFNILTFFTSSASQS